MFKFARIEDKKVAEFLSIEADNEDAANDKIKTMFHKSLLWVHIPESIEDDIAIGAPYNAKSREFK